MSRGNVIHRLLHLHAPGRWLYSSTSCPNKRLCSFLTHSPTESKIAIETLQLQHPFHHLLGFSLEPLISAAYHYSSLTPRFLNTSSTQSNDQENANSKENPLLYGTSEEEEASGETDGWEEEEEVESKAGDGGDGGGVVLQGVPWGERALSIAREVLLQFDDDIELYAFKTTPRGYVYVRLDKLSNEYGCPSMEELESYCQEYRKKLEEVGARGEIPDDLALEVSSPGAERILKVPDDLSRFREMPMRVCYVEDHGPEKDGIFFLESIETEAENCIWKLADVKENRDPESKGRPLSRKRRDWRLKLPFKMHRKVTLYLEF
ncbi:hypothetical protein JCGZ_15729 [Jatropha curcas]|uniref:DUF7912 domain-containing protein n=1 Tax=Jatropha curcas TaxID=180498 RepID=A0A067KYV0_JATCU|nr:uncharacterized protein LOC105630563 [Jatropha curcas]KDP41322.1 hypothetical protein JCGZ_15729 [Jatropha curcas]